MTWGRSPFPAAAISGFFPEGGAVIEHPDSDKVVSNSKVVNSNTVVSNNTVDIDREAAGKPNKPGWAGKRGAAFADFFIGFPRIDDRTA